MLRIKVRGQRDLMTVIGSAASVSAGESIEAQGAWVNDREHGPQFRADHLRVVPPTKLEGIEKYLGSGMVKGIGPHFARKLVRAFGETQTFGREERRMRVSDLQRLKRYLRAQGGKGACMAIVKKFGWSDDKLARLIDDSDSGIKRAHYGRIAGIALIGSERGQRGSVPLYRDVRRILETTWARNQGWQSAIAIDTALNGRAETGAWSRPDCVLAWYPARRRSLDEPPTLSSYEIEAPGKFDIRSVYEAHAHGFGADFSWVVSFRPIASSKAGLPHPDWNRIMAAAKTCGIGLLSVTNSGNAATWQIERAADRRADGERVEFIRRAVPASERDKANRPLEVMQQA